MCITTDSLLLADQAQSCLTYLDQVQQQTVSRTQLLSAIAVAENETLTNTTLVDDGQREMSEYDKYVIYVSQNIVVATVNLLIVLAIMRHGVLRKNKAYIVVGGLALADVLNSAGYVAAGVYRIYLIFNFLDKVQVSRWDCMMTVHNWLFVIGEPISGVMLTCVSLDRLIAVSIPTKYFSFGRRYSLTLCGIFYGFVGILVLFCVYLAYAGDQELKWDAICFTTYAINNPDHEWFIPFYFAVRTWGGILSVVIYAAVLIIHRMYSKKMAERMKEGSAQQKQAMKAQKRLMVTLGLSSLCTLLFFVTPNAIMTFAPIDVDTIDLLTPWLMSISNINPFMNIFLYTSRHKDIRAAILYLFKCKELPANFNSAAASSVNATKTVEVKEKN